MRFFKTLRGRNDRGGTPEFSALLDRSMEELRLKTEAHHGVWHFGEEERWDFSQDQGDLVFTFAETIATAPAQVIGTFSLLSSTWMWAWANPTLNDDLKADSLRVRKYGEQHGIERLVTPKWSAEEMDGWKMVAIACHLCDRQGAYRGPTGAGYVFMTFGEIELRARRSA